MKLDIQRMKRQKIEKKLRKKGSETEKPKRERKSLILTESFIWNYVFGYLIKYHERLMQSQS